MDEDSSIPKTAGWRVPRFPRLPAWLAHGVLVVGGIVVFVMLAWGHLGLGALLFPPPSTTTRQVATAGPYRVTLDVSSAQFIAGDTNSATITLQDAAGNPVHGATVTVVPRMVAMVMQTPAETGAAEGGGRYSIHPAFAMAGQWRLNVTISRQGAAQQSASFDANVRWR